jgi:cell division protein FtsQ
VNGDSLQNQLLRNIPFAALVQALEIDPYIRSVKMFSNIKGEVHVQVKQKLPVLRIINSETVSYYLDDRGGRIPLADNFTANVVIATGNISMRDSVTEKSLHRMAMYIRSSDFWRAQIQQIHVNAEKEFELIPRVGNHLIVFGDDQRMEQKFNDLYLFYREGLAFAGWDKYKTIAVNYNGQIVCTKH